MHTNAQLVLLDSMIVAKSTKDKWYLVPFSAFGKWNNSQVVVVG
jgi:hypothetical protein